MSQPFAGTKLYPTPKNIGTRSIRTQDPRQRKNPLLLYVHKFLPQFCIRKLYNPDKCSGYNFQKFLDLIRVDLKWILVFHLDGTGLRVSETIVVDAGRDVLVFTIKGKSNGFYLFIS